MVKEEKSSLNSNARFNGLFDYHYSVLNLSIINILYAAIIIKCLCYGFCLVFTLSQEATRMLGIDVYISWVSSCHIFLFSLLSLVSIKRREGRERENAKNRQFGEKNRTIEVMEVQRTKRLPHA